MGEGPLLRPAFAWGRAAGPAQVPPAFGRPAGAQQLSRDGAVRATLRHPVADRLRGAAVAAPGGSPGWAGEAATQALLTMALDFDETAFAGPPRHPPPP